MIYSYQQEQKHNDAVSLIHDLHLKTVHSEHIHFWKTKTVADPDVDENILPSFKL